jgi:hypothetical protein
MRIKLGSVSRILSGDKVVDNYALNLLGVQVLRTIAARGVYNIFPASPNGIVKERFAELIREGIVAWPDFLPRDEFERVRQECETLIRNHSQVRVERSGANRIEKLNLRNVEISPLSSLHRLTTDERLQKILETAEKRPLSPLSAHATVEHLIQGPAHSLEDPQTRIHSDTFFTCHKAWLYLSDVSLEDGPLIYLKGSHKVTPRQLLHIYKWSCTRTPDVEPSRRVTVGELAKMRERRAILTCASNTLVIANVCGYHGRLQGNQGRERWAVHLALRTNPFGVFLKQHVLAAAESIRRTSSTGNRGRRAHEGASEADGRVA